MKIVGKGFRRSSGAMAAAAAAEAAIDLLCYGFSFFLVFSSLEEEKQKLNDQ